MRNYIILNNQNSNEISGLIIQELAPISKPLQRTQVETIDGRDGDIVTPLGYAAYNKKIKIGLYGDFDINEIIAYFATKGTAIFSNEPDKYYYYQIVDQIDYDRLVRYRVATVTMHVQPFKYSATEGTITVDSSDTVSGEGSDIALDGTAEAPFNVLRHKGNATQTGTPTPSAPVPVQTVTGENVVKICGKNLFNKDNYDSLNAYVDGSTITASANNVLVWIPCQPSTSYAITVVGSNVTTGIYSAPNIPVVGGTANWLGSIAAGDTTGVFTTKPEAKYIVVRIWTNTASQTVQEALDALQIELGSTATAYQAYQGQSYLISLGSLELCGIGDDGSGGYLYQDGIYKNLTDNKWYVHKEVGKTLFSNLTWDGPFDGYHYIASFTPVADGNYTDALCTHFKNKKAYPTADGDFAIRNDGDSISCYSSSNTTLAAWNTWVSANNPIMYYPLATPTDEPITDQDLIDALDELYDQAHSYKGHTHITATTADGNAPAVLSVEVGEDNESTVTNAGNTTSRPILTIYGQGDIGVYINDVEVLDVALGDEGYITLDSVEMEAYKDTTANLKNRLVTGDYSKLALNAGDNKIYFTGKVTKYEISKYSRWL